MNFKRNILGLAVTVALTSLSVSAIADVAHDIAAPEAFDFVDLTALASTEAALTGKTEYVTVEDARDEEFTANTNLTGALTDQSDIDTLINAANAAKAAANALTAGQLIGGQTQAEIVASKNTALGLTALGALTGDGLLFQKIALDAAVVSTTATAASKSAALTAISAGVISNQLAAADAAQDAAGVQGVANGTVANGSGDGTLGKILFDAEATLGTAAVTGGAAAAGLYLDVELAAAALVTAQGQAVADAALGTDTYDGADGSVAAATPGVKSVSGFNIADLDVLDLRDGDTQLLFTVGTTAVNDETAL